MTEKKYREREIGVRELAERLGVSRPTARKQLQEIRDKYGKMFVYSRGNRLYTTEDALKRLIPLKPSKELEAVLARHAERLAEVERRLNEIDVQIDSFMEFRRQIRQPAKPIDVNSIR